MLNRYFNLTARGTDVRTEVVDRQQHLGDDAEVGLHQQVVDLAHGAFDRILHGHDADVRGAVSHRVDYVAKLAAQHCDQ